MKLNIIDCLLRKSKNLHTIVRPCTKRKLLIWRENNRRVYERLQGKRMGEQKERRDEENKKGRF